jgi:hypothetical protein
MTIDSAYFMERYVIDDDVKYTFTFEHTGPDSIEVYIVQADGVSLPAEYNPDLVEN